MRSPSMPNLFRGSSPGLPPPDLHRKVQAEISRRSHTDTINNAIRTFSASKALHEVLGMRDPEPFVPPPAMPRDLPERFEAGLPGPEQLHAAEVFATRASVTFVASASTQQGKATLANILEERESPVRASPAHQNATSANNKLTISVPKYTSGKQAVAAAQRYTLMDVHSDAAEDDSSQHTDNESDRDYGSWKYGSSTTLAASDYSRPGSADSCNSLPPPLFPPRRSSLFPLPNLDSSDTNGPPLPSSVIQVLSESRPTPISPTSLRSQHPLNGASNYLHATASGLRKSESLPVLFPSPGVRPVAKVPVHNKIARRYAEKYIEANGAFDNDSLQSGQDVTSSPPPRIMIQAPSPVKPTKSRKRAPSPANQDEFGPSLAQRSRRDDTTGLPVLPLDAEDEWTDDFPGNTYALLTVLLTWSHTMWTKYHLLHDPKIFATHPAFAYPVTPPVRKQLVSVSFYDTGVNPHKEVRFFGPGDAAEMSYHEVDVFADPKSKTSPPPSPRCNASVVTFKETLGLTEKGSSKNTRYVSMPHRAKTGEGRWCYILIKGHAPPDGSTPPHIMLAWHISAVTSTSDCLHTLYTDDAASKPVPVQNKVKHFSSLQNLAQALCSQAKFNFHHSLRTASSSSELPAVGPYAIGEQREGVTLVRTVMKLEKAGGIPLIEGFRFDVKAFREWMEACGRGRGKVILWRERDTS
ncbi:hypothetical protein N0V87_005158 [Didymella glomerata]|uniref:Uncharacterized protein n=1 Tax=Didymella glomerata TaxID=749621 RepID=A0A9W8WZ14_9PLEO|nr:hypothetical protein N0V87_005158 [Didymella glomerata]